MAKHSLLKAVIGLHPSEHKIGTGKPSTLKQYYSLLLAKVLNCLPAIRNSIELRCSSRKNAPFQPTS